jgi:hypothetical protein
MPVLQELLQEAEQLEVWQESQGTHHLYVHPPQVVGAAWQTWRVWMILVR